jgi:hypothetical protein
VCAGWMLTRTFSLDCAINVECFKRSKSVLFARAHSWHPGDGSILCRMLSELCGRVLFQQHSVVSVACVCVCAGVLSLLRWRLSCLTGATAHCWIACSTRCDQNCMSPFSAQHKGTPQLVCTSYACNLLVWLD